MSDIYMKALSPLTYRALEKLCMDKNWIDIQGYMEARDVALLTYRLQFVADDDDIFPHGKWATIQHLQDMVASCARSEASG